MGFSRQECWSGLLFPSPEDLPDPGKTIALTIWTFVGKVMSLFFNTLSRFVNSFTSKERVSFNFMAAVTLCSDTGAKKIKSVTVSIVSPSVCHEVMEPDAMIIVFFNVELKPAFSLSSFTLIKRLFSYSSLSAIRVVSSAYLRLLIYLLAVLMPACESSSPPFCMMFSA